MELQIQNHIQICLLKNRYLGQNMHRIYHNENI